MPVEEGRMARGGRLTGEAFSVVRGDRRRSSPHGDGQQAIRVSLTKPGRTLLRRARSAGVKVHLTGVGIQPATIVLTRRHGSGGRA
jgi:hypothetical protein